MADEPIPTKPVENAGGAVPTTSPFTPSLQVALQDLAQMRRERFELEKSAEKRLAEERERWEHARSRLVAEYEEKIRAYQAESSVLVRTAGRLYDEVEQLRIENARLKYVFAQPVPEAAPPADAPKPSPRAVSLVQPPSPIGVQRVTK